jgi:hypothetical protein
VSPRVAARATASASAYQTPIPIPFVPNPTPACKNPEYVKKWTQLALEYNGRAADLAILTGLACTSILIPGNQVTGGVACGALGTASGVAWKLNAIYSQWANDPPDPNFTRVAPATRTPLPRVRASGRVSRRAAEALNALLRNMATDASLVRALTHAYERSQGALLAGDVAWEARQRAAVSRYASRLARVIRGRERLRVRARRALEASRFPTVTITRADVRKAQRRLRTHGFPKRTQRILAVVGLTPSEREQFRASLVNRDPRALRPLPFPAMLTNRAVISSERAAAEAWAQLAAAMVPAQPRAYFSPAAGPRSQVFRLYVSGFPPSRTPASSWVPAGAATPGSTFHAPARPGPGQ